MFKGLGLLGIVAFVVFIVLLGPFLTIWSLNTLFPSLNIQYTWETWVAVVVLGSFYTRLSTKKD
jgi:hypothetical protein